jgi:hypothetical protein
VFVTFLLSDGYTGLLGNGTVEISVTLALVSASVAESVSVNPLQKSDCGNAPLEFYLYLSQIGTKPQAHKTKLKQLFTCVSYLDDTTSPKTHSPALLHILHFFKRMYPSILSFETINKLKLSFECGIPRPQDAGHLCFRLFFDF